MDPSYVLFFVLLFVAVVLAIEGGYQVWASKNSAEAKRVAARLRTPEEHQGAQGVTSIERRAAVRRWNWLDDNAVVGLPKGAELLRYVETSGTGRGISEMLIYSAVLGFIGVIVPIVMVKPWTFSVLLGAVLASLPWFWLGRKRTQRLRLFERQIPEALDLMGRALRAGHAFPTGVKMVGDEMPEPIAKDFRILYDETNFGMSQNEALMRLADRVPIDDLRYFVIAVLIQRESGGNLAEILGNIGFIIRERLKLFDKVKALSAEGRLSAWILALLPFVVIGVLSVLSPTFIKIFWTDPAAEKLAGFCLGLMVLGILWMRKIVRIHV